MRKTIFFLFNALLIVVPIIFYPYSSEVFEFNKIVVVYAITVLIVAAWLAQMILQKRIIFRRTILDIPLIVFWISQLVSTLFSIDSRTSLLGYYSRFNGGLLSLTSYTLLYWAYVANIKSQETKIILRNTLYTLAFVCLWAVGEHFGHSPSCLVINGRFDADCWVQDVVNRVFATLGQPNWLAAYIVALLPLTWIKGVSKKNLFRISLSILFVATLLFTKSRSGILAAAVAFISFWGLSFFRQYREKTYTWRGLSQGLALSSLIIVLLSLAFGTPWTPSLKEIFKKNTPPASPAVVTTGPALESGGTESGEIRKIVWKGALDVWRQKPLFGSGTETFAFSYWSQRPIAHNQTSEWDFVYNKAHNEYLNFLATTGLVGLLSYLALVGFSLYLILTSSFSDRLDQEEKETSVAFFAGLLAILVSNFFGFSVVTVSLLTFLLPAFTVSFTNQPKSEKKSSLTQPQKVFLITLSLLAGYLLIAIGRYWYADWLYAKARTEGRKNNFNQKITVLVKAIKISPKEALYRSELAQTYAEVAALLSQDTEKNQEEIVNAVQKLTSVSITQGQMALSLSPQNPGILRGIANSFSDLALTNPEYLQGSIQILDNLSQLAPTDPSVYYQLGLISIRAGKIENAVVYLKKALELKPNYKNPRLKLAAVYKIQGQLDLARDELNYLLTQVDPQDETAQGLLDEINP